MKEHRQKIVVIVGPTASGKSECAVRLAETLSGEIVNADSLQVYRGMEIGTARPSAELMERVPHHLFGMVTPEVNFTAADFIAAADAAIASICARGRVPVVVGGTGLYIRALLCGLAESPAGDDSYRQSMVRYAEQEGPQALHDLLSRVDPDTAARLHVNDRLRIIRALEVYHQTGTPLSRFQEGHGFVENRYAPVKIGLDVERSILYGRIDSRVDAMIDAGLVDEVESLLSQGYSPELKPLGAIGYREICDYLRGRLTLADAVDLIKRNTRRYAKRQLTWFRRDGAIKWLEYPVTFVNICKIVCDHMDRRGI
jgi:tRNA dimethylallyltransferase